MEMNGELLIKLASAKDYAKAIGGAALVTGGTIAGLNLAIGKQGRKQVKSEHRDPRLYSNLKGMLTGKSREERVAAHKNLGKGDGTIIGAMKAGLK